MNALANARPPVAAQHPAGLRPQSFAELERFAVMAAKSGMVPKDYLNRPENVMVAIQMGSEVGLAPMQALQNIAVINGRPSLWGDAMLALCRASGLLEEITETVDGQGDAQQAVCTVKRRGEKPVIGKFSMTDARRAKLFGKDGPWQTYPERMLKLRARGFALRDAFPDVLRGLISAEEARDTPAEAFAGPTIDGKPEAADTARETINKEVPLAEKPARKPSVSEWLDGLAMHLQTQTTVADVDAIVGSEEIQKALATLRNGALHQLNKLIADALDRVSGQDTSTGNAA